MPPASVPSLPAARVGQETGRVLIVDDNEELVDTLRAVIASGVPGLGIVTAANGKTALQLAQKGFDVAIVDVKLPDVSGIDLIQPLREASPFAEVLLLTGFASVDAAIGALRSGAFAFVLKSFRPEELISIVEQALGKVQLKREREELERRYRDLVEVTDVLVLAIDVDDNVALMNRKAASMAGTAPDQALGQPLLEAWIPAEDRPAMRSALTSLRVSGDLRTFEVETGFSATSSVVRSGPCRPQRSAPALQRRE